jgi:hypothetical protein
VFKSLSRIVAVPIEQAVPIDTSIFLDLFSEGVVEAEVVRITSLLPVRWYGIDAVFHFLP